MRPLPSLIERELSLMRERETAGAADVQLSLFTLLVLRAAPRGARADAATGTAPSAAALNHLLGRRPARVIMITPSEVEVTDAAVSGRCAVDSSRPSDGRAVCLEEVDILAGSDGVGADPGAWSPLLLRGLPVYAWLPDGPAAGAPGPWEPVLAAAGRLVDGLVVDSSAGSFPGLARLCRTVDGAFPVWDFSWRRGRVLREQTARAFDPPETRPLASAVSGVRLLGGSPAEAELYFRWINGRLSRGVRAAHEAPGPLADGFAVRFTLEGAAGRRTVEIGCTRGGCLSRAGETAGYRFPTDGEMLLEAVDGMAPDPLFMEAVRGEPSGRGATGPAPREAALP